MKIPAPSSIGSSALKTSHDSQVKRRETSGISAIDASAKATDIYDLSGLRVSSMEAPGVYIVKTADGRTSKVTK